MNIIFRKWNEDPFGVPQALFSEGCHEVAFTRAELPGPLRHLHNDDWRTAVEFALAAPSPPQPSGLKQSDPCKSPLGPKEDSDSVEPAD